MMLWFIGTVFAQTTYNLPNASEHSDGLTFSLGTGVAALRAGPLPSIRGSVSFDRSKFGMYLTSTAYRGQQTEGFDVLSFRYLALSKDKFRLAPTLTISDHWGISKMDYRLTSRLGVAIETGANKWLWDLSINIAGWQFRPEYLDGPISKMSVLDTVLTLETGLRYEIKEDNFFRLGLLGPMPSFRYILPYKNGTMELTGATLGTQHVLQFDVRL